MANADTMLLLPSSSHSPPDVLSFQTRTRVVFMSLKSYLVVRRQGNSIKIKN